MKTVKEWWGKKRVYTVIRHVNKRGVLCQGRRWPGTCLHVTNCRSQLCVCVVCSTRHHCSVVEGACSSVLCRVLLLLSEGYMLSSSYVEDVCVRVVEGPRLAFRTIGCVGEGAGVDRTIRGVGVPARRS